MKFQPLIALFVTTCCSSWAGVGHARTPPAPGAPQAATVSVDRKLLAPQYPLEVLKGVLVPREGWRPYPTVSAPRGLEKVPPRVRAAYVREGERLLDARWEPLPATVFLEYVRTEDRSRYEALSFGRRDRLSKLVLAELFERRGRFVDQIVNGVWAVCEESFWGVPAHLGAQKAGPGLPDVTDPYVDLFAAETGAVLAWTDYLLGPQLDKVNPLIRRRIAAEVDRRILTPYSARDDWGWMGFTWRRQNKSGRPVNNWNPWINSNVLTCALVLEKDESRRLRIVHKVMDSLDNFVEPYPADGGCDEGPAYWSHAGGALFINLELLHSASDGRIDIYDQPLVKEIGRYIYRAYISAPYFINFADSAAKVSPEPALVFRYGRAIGDETMTRYASFAAKEIKYDAGAQSADFARLGRALPALFGLEQLLSTPPAEPLPRDVWLPDTQVMAARSREGGGDGFYLAAKGGHNDESHNHNDVGNYIVYHDGRPVLVDAGAQTYTAKTFGRQRYEMWNNQSAYHNLPTINNVMQRNGRKYGAREVRYEADARRASLSLDIAAAYPEEAKVESWARTVTLERGAGVTVSETYRLRETTAPLTLSFMTPLRPETIAPGRIKLADAGGRGREVYLIYDAERFEPRVEVIPLTDARMNGSWGSELKRIVLAAKKNTLADSFEIKVESK